MWVAAERVPKAVPEPRMGPGARLAVPARCGDTRASRPPCGARGAAVPPTPARRRGRAKSRILASACGGDDVEVIDERLPLNQEFVVFREVARLFVVVAGEAPNGVKRLPQRYEREVGAVLPHAAQDVYAAIAGCRAALAHAGALEVGRVLIRARGGRDAVPDARDERLRSRADRARRPCVHCGGSRCSTWSWARTTARASLPPRWAGAQRR